MNNTILYKELSDRIIGLAFTVHRTLGPGPLEARFARYGKLESAYQEAMCWEIKHADIPFERQKVYPLNYKGDYISSYFADIVVDNAVILELKAVRELNDNMTAQVINYLKLSKIPVGYLVNFANARLERLKLRCAKAAVCVPAGIKNPRVTGGFQLVAIPSPYEEDDFFSSRRALP